MNKSWVSFIVPLLFILYHSAGYQKKKNHFVEQFSKTSYPDVLPIKWTNFYYPINILSPNLKIGAFFIMICV